MKILSKYCSRYYKHRFESHYTNRSRVTSPKLSPKYASMIPSDSCNLQRNSNSLKRLY